MSCTSKCEFYVCSVKNPIIVRVSIFPQLNKILSTDYHNIQYFQMLRFKVITEFIANIQLIN